MLLISETHGGLGICKDHMRFGNEYLELHNLALKYYLSDNISDYQIDDLFDSLNKLNKSERPNINIGAKIWAKIAIEKWKEMNIWWK